MEEKDDKPPPSGEEIEPVSMRELEMIVAPGKLPPPMARPPAPGPPKPPRPIKPAARSTGDLKPTDLDAFATLSGSTPPPAMEAKRIEVKVPLAPRVPAAPLKPSAAKPPAPAPATAAAARPAPRAPLKSSPEGKVPVAPMRVVDVGASIGASSVGRARIPTIPEAPPPPSVRLPSAKKTHGALFELRPVHEVFRAEREDAKADAELVDTTEPAPPDPPKPAESEEQAAKPAPIVVPPPTVEGAKARPLPKPPAAPRKEGRTTKIGLDDDAALALAIAETLPKNPAEPRKAPDSALEDLRRLAGDSQRPKAGNAVDFDDLFGLTSPVAPSALAAPILPADLASLTDEPEPGDDEKEALAAKDATPGPRAPVAPRKERKAAQPAPDGDAPLSTRPPVSRRPIPRGADSTAEKRASRRPKSGDTKSVRPSKSPAKLDSAPAPLESIPPWQAKKRSKLPIFAGLALVLVGGIYAIVRATSGPSAEPEPTTSALPAPPPTPTTTVAMLDPTTPATTTPQPTTTGKPKKPGKNDPVPPPGTPTAIETTPAPTTTAAPTSKPTATSVATTPPPASGSGEFDRSAASASLSGMAGSAAGCKQPGDPSGVATVTVTFAPSGRATQANVSGPPFAGTATGGCIARVMRGATVPPFSGTPQAVSKTVHIP